MIPASRVNAFGIACAFVSIVLWSGGQVCGEHHAVRLPRVENAPPPRVALRAPDPHAVRFGLADFHNLAMQNNPTLIQAQAQIEAAESAAFQAGRYPNPVLGYTSDQVGIEGTAGEFQGGFINQEIVRGGKLRLSQQKYLQRAEIARTNACAQQQRVLNDICLHFFEALAMQRQVAIKQRLLANGEDNVQTTKERLNLGQANQAEMLRAEVDVQRDFLELTSAQRDQMKAWRELVSVAGVPTMQPAPLAGEMGDAISLEWDGVLFRLLSESPELVAARQKVAHDEIAVEREIVEPIPNLLVGADVGYNFENNNTVAGLSLGVPLPVFNRNRGTIGQASADLMQSHAEVKRLELELTTRLAEQFRNYETARTRVDRYRNAMVPKSREAYDLLVKAYKQRRGTWMDVLAAQRALLEIESGLVDESLRLAQSQVLLEGMLLENGLMRPPAPMSGGHIDATPNPR